jgi:hypothetical protein
MRGGPVVPVVRGTPVEERLIEPLKISGRLRLPKCLVEVIVQDDNVASRLRRHFHLENRVFRLADPLDCPGGRYNIETAVEPFAHVERQNIGTFEAQVSDSAMVFSRDRQIGVVTINTQHRTSRTHRPRNISRDRSRAATNIEDRHACAQDPRKIRVIPLQSASIQDPWIGAV